jgi:peptide/nickel transport system permease protein
MSYEEVFTTRLRRTYRKASEIFGDDPFGKFGLVVLFVFIFIGIFGGQLAPYESFTTQRDAAGNVLRVTGPSLDHPLGTTQFGYDVLTHLILAFRTSLLVGLSAAVMAVLIGTNIGLISGYFGGSIDSALMRLTDLAFGLPFLPFALVFIVVVGQSLWAIIVVIGLLLWRSTARVIRSEVLTHKQRPYVESAKAAGASDLRIMYVHILPNVLPLAFLYTAFSVAWSILIEAGISFLGFGDPDVISWGRMIFRALNADVVHVAWWWTVPPGLAILLVAMSVFFVARSLEKVIHPELRYR